MEETVFKNLSPMTFYMKSAFSLILKMHKSTDACQHKTVNYIIRKFFKKQLTFSFAGLT